MCGEQSLRRLFVVRTVINFFKATIKTLHPVVEVG